MDTLLRNIYEQPKVFGELAANYIEQSRLKNKLAPLKERSFANVILTGMGTSYFSDYPAYLYLQAHGATQVQWVDASELLHYQLNSIGDNTLLILVSQSGESYEVVKLLQELHGKGVSPFKIGLTMTEKESSLKRQADLLLSLSANEETSLGAFKSFTASIIVLLLIACFFSDSGDNVKQIEKEITALPEMAKRELDNWTNFISRQVLSDCSSACFVARGPAYCAALAGGLLTIELAKCNAMCFTGGQFRHGPIEMIFNKGSQYVVLAPDGKTQDLCIRLAQDISSNAADVLLLTSDQSIKETEHLHVLRMPAINEYLAPALYAIPLQLFASGLAIQKGIAPGSARIISKVTTFE